MNTNKVKDDHLEFQADVGRLLHIVANALYSEKEVFVRELVSNAADSCERRRIAALSSPELAPEGGYRISIALDKANKTFTISDTGAGMTREELISNLGSIASSGTRKFLDSLSQSDAQDISQIGQFGVGFYSAFMVADQVRVESRKVGESGGWVWESDGVNGFRLSELQEAEKADHHLDGVRITLSLKDDESEFLEEMRIRHIVRKYSDHISIPVTISSDQDSSKDSKDLSKSDSDEAVNTASALWAKSKSEVSQEDYEAFYSESLHQLGKPWATLHFHAEGTLDYRGLLFIPDVRPMDLFDPARKSHLRLHVKRVFVTDSAEGLVPQWLRFLRGVIDSEDLPLQISREMLQNDRIVSMMRSGILKRVFAELKSRLEADPADYDRFWEAYGPVFKEGLYDAPEKENEILPLCRFKSTAVDGWVSLSDYLERMKEGQEAIYFVHGESEAAARRSPQLEGFAARGVEVLLLTDPVDEFWVTGIENFEETPLRSVTRGSTDLSKIAKTEAAEETSETNTVPDEKELATLIAFLKTELDDAVKDIRRSDRLTTSPSCLVAEDGDMDIRLEQMLRQAGQIRSGTARVLEINPNHLIIQSMSKQIAAKDKPEDHKQTLKDSAWLVYDLARLSDGEAVHDHSAFSDRLVRLLTQNLTSS